MGTLGGMHIGDRQAPAPSGAAFLLREASPLSSTVAIEPTWEVEVREGCQHVVARLLDHVDAAGALAIGLERAQQGLDLLSVLGSADLVTRESDTEHLIWWRDGEEQIVRWVSTATITMTANINVEVRNAKGEPVPQAQPVPLYSAAFRHYRLSQVTDDLFDSYRNMYLAFELLLSDAHPKKKRERERSWLKRALVDADGTLDLSALFNGRSDWCEHVLRSIHDETRIALFHAKSSGVHIVPQRSIRERVVVSGALEMLTRIVLRMCERWKSARRIGAMVMPHWVYTNMAAALSEATVFISDDRGPVDLAEQDLAHERFATAVRVSAQMVGDRPKGQGPAIMARVPVESLRAFAEVRRTDVVVNDAPYVGGLLESSLTVDGIDHLEVQVNARMLNARQPREAFKQ